MRNLVHKRLIKSSFTRSSRSNPSLPFLLTSKRNAESASQAEEEAETIVFPREGPEFSYGLNWALASKGVIVNDKAFSNLELSELKQKGATSPESLSGLPVHVRGSVTGGASDISKAQFGKLLKQVTNHLSSISNIFVHDGAVGSPSKCDAKVRVISDNPTAIVSLSNVLWKTPSRSVSHDSCPLTIYVATSVSSGVGDAIGIGTQANNGFIAADIERLSLVLCGKAFSDGNGTKQALAALSEPIISARGGIPLSARLLLSGDSMIVLFASKDIIRSCADSLLSADAGVILSSQGVAPLFPIANSCGSNLFKLPAAVILVSSDSSGSIPSVSKLSPGQAAYHFLAGYQNGNFVPAYRKGPSSIYPLELAKALLLKLKDNKISAFLVNVSEGEKTLSGMDIINLVESTLSKNIPPFHSKGGDLQEKYKTFLSEKFQELPKEFSF
ncbi:Phosphoenolpyruvate carboxykinase (ATP) [Quillaja saponaria]|uniref:phosphoenolpyruvate carboxykinase (ATP) n=1 Tax=Quillaja saponaria TaxID=32244 RepID=A0AAD7LPD8_QUISA|nr:Phosphoenolpyruvate carboxykinase (ATP) [Quillaja saponaria]